MRSNRRTVLALTLAAIVGLAVASAFAADKDDQSCIDAAAKANQMFAATMLKELGKCREKPSDPSTAQCDENLPKIQKAAEKRDKAVAKKCKKLDPVRAFGYAGCQVPGCESADASAAGYQACVACATTGAMARVNRTGSNACGNGFLDAGEECDDGNRVDGDSCSATCEIEAVCGDGTRAKEEQCDPPGLVAPSCAAGQICTSTCTCETVECGDGITNGDEECDPPGSDDECPAGEVCNSRCECAPACECCDLTPTELRTTVKIASGGFLCVGGANVGMACTSDSECPGGACNGCGVLRNFRCSNDVNKVCASDSDCGASNTCDEVIGSGLPQGLECGALYTGGGLNSVPLPFRIPDTSTVRAKVTSCDPETGQVVTGATTKAETGSSLTCSEGRKCTGGGNAPCVLDADCPAAQMCENRCLFGAPLPVPNSMTPPTSVCTINAVATDLTGTGTCDGDSTVNVSLRSEVYLTGDLFTMTTPPIIPGVQPCPLCSRLCAAGVNAKVPCDADGDCPGSTCTAGTLCLGGPNELIPCTPGTSDSAALGDTQNAFPTSHNCPPVPSANITSSIGGLPISLEFTTGTQIKRGLDLSPPQAERVFCGFCRDSTNGGGLCFEGDTEASCPARAVGEVKDGNAVPCTSKADCADGDTYETCTQRNPGAFSRAAATVFSLTGSPAACLEGGQPKAATAVGGFCIPPTFNSIIDGAGDLPGPGAVSLEVEAQLVP